MTDKDVEAEVHRMTAWSLVRRQVGEQLKPFVFPAGKEAEEQYRPAVERVLKNHEKQHEMRNDEQGYYRTVKLFPDPTVWNPFTVGWDGEIALDETVIYDPLKWAEPRTIRLGMDIFDHMIWTRQIATVFGFMAAASRHSFQVETEHFDRAIQWFRWAEAAGPGARLECCSAALSFESMSPGEIPDEESLHCKHAADPDGAWPLPNVAIGGKFLSDANFNKVCDLLNIPAAKHFARVAANGDLEVVPCNVTQTNGEVADDDYFNAITGQGLGDGQGGQAGPPGKYPFFETVRLVGSRQ